jgi:crotonobetainyl-CoA:carnitine CoA-transferase CaiB-like acyl-CoA transferase
MTVIDVKSSSRTDPTRSSSPAFYALLHERQEHRILDFTDRRSLQELVRSADVVIEASRPRAFADLGISAAASMADGRPRTWLRITGHADPARVAFGDDAAVAAGLVGHADGGPVFAADAIADPITGLLGALAVTACAPSAGSTLIELSLAQCAAYCVRGFDDGADWGNGETSYPTADPHVARRERP